VKVASFFAALLFLATSAVMAHHGNAGYDMTTMTMFQKATITEIEWTNPHCQIRFDATNDKGTVEHWTLEAPPPSIACAARMGPEVPASRRRGED
jgi:hypothetical protein